MKINEGMYVRTKEGLIDKVIIDYKGCCNNPNCNCKHVSCEHNYYDEENIIKASDNLIDLIEVGDYVNDYKILEIVKGFKVIVDKLELNTYDGNYYLKQFTNNQIKSIVTKEQFNSMKYEVGE